MNQDEQLYDLRIEFAELSEYAVLLHTTGTAYVDAMEAEAVATDNYEANDNFAAYHDALVAAGNAAEAFRDALAKNPNPSGGSSLGSATASEATPEGAGHDLEVTHQHYYGPLEIVANHCGPQTPVEYEVWSKDGEYQVCASASKEDAEFIVAAYAARDVSLTEKKS